MAKTPKQGAAAPTKTTEPPKELAPMAGSAGAQEGTGQPAPGLEGALQQARPLEAWHGQEGGDTFLVIFDSNVWQNAWWVSASHCPGDALPDDTNNPWRMVRAATEEEIVQHGNPPHGDLTQEQPGDIQEQPGDAQDGGITLPFSALAITSIPTRFCRAGRRFTHEETIVPLADLSEEEMVLLRDEPMLRVRDIQVSLEDLDLAALDEHNEEQE